MRLWWSAEQCFQCKFHDQLATRGTTANCASFRPSGSRSPWETGKCVWWQRADAHPWMVAGIWSEWTDPESGELVSNFAMLTFNVNNYPLLSRLHRPEKDRETGDVLPFEQQDKRGEAHIEPENWLTWLQGDIKRENPMLVAAPNAFYDQGDAVRTDACRTISRREIVQQPAAQTGESFSPPGPLVTGV